MLYAHLRVNLKMQFVEETVSTSPISKQETHWKTSSHSHQLSSHSFHRLPAQKCKERQARRTACFLSWGLEAQQGIMWRRPFEETDQTLYRDKVYFYARVENPNSTTASSRHISSDLLSEIATKDEQKIIDR